MVLSREIGIYSLHSNELNIIDTCLSVTNIWLDHRLLHIQTYVLLWGCSQTIKFFVQIKHIFVIGWCQWLKFFRFFSFRWWCHVQIAAIFYQSAKLLRFHILFWCSSFCFSCREEHFFQIRHKSSTFAAYLANLRRIDCVKSIRYVPIDHWKILKCANHDGYYGSAIKLNLCLKYRKIYFLSATPKTSEKTSKNRK